jgi:putative toxin-antitoxin system antitoxin component (TIGR02293 family)
LAGKSLEPIFRNAAKRSRDIANPGESAIPPAAQALKPAKSDEAERFLSDYISFWARSDLEAPSIAELDDHDLANAVSAGLSKRTIFQVMNAGYSAQEIYTLVFWRNSPSGSGLSADESDRVVRLIRIAARAKEVFGNPEKAWRWLRKPKKAFNGKTCVEMLITEYGSREVENMLTRIEHGMAA